MQPKEAALVRHALDSVAREQNETSHRLHVQRTPRASCYFACALGSLACQANAAALRQASFVQPADEAVPCGLRLILHLFQSEAWRAQGNAVANAGNATYDGGFFKLAQESSQSLNMQIMKSIQPAVFLFTPAAHQTFLPAANAAGRHAMEEAAKGCRRAAVDRSSAARGLSLRFEQELGLILKILAFVYPSWFHCFGF
jgi:hypothetical protein